jgi:hypothetical protein
MTRAMTYDDIAAEFGITRKSAERLVKRKRWMRRNGNDGKARIDVPEEALPASPPDAPSGEPLGEPHGRGHDGGHGDPHWGPQALLKHLVERLEAEVAELRPKAVERDMFAGQNEVLRAMLEQTRIERDAERQKAAEHDVLSVQVETLKAALEESRQERDRWAVQAHVLAHPPAPPSPTPARSRSLLGWFRAARR